MKSLEGKVAIVTGGSAGIGKATVLKFVDEGAKVAVCDINEERGLELETTLNKEGNNITFYKVNTADESQINEAATKVINDYGKIDILVNNAGITKDSSLLKMTTEQWNQVIDINLTGVFLCTKAVAPHIVAKGYCRIMNASSVVGLYGNFGQTNYAATKAGVIAMTQTWAKELGRKGINVNAVAPGFILTAMVQAMPEEVLAKMSEKVPLKRFGNPEDIANIYAFLASDQADYINGTTISVDGGITL